MFLEFLKLIPKERVKPKHSIWLAWMTIQECSLTRVLSKTAIKPSESSEHKNTFQNSHLAVTITSLKSHCSVRSYRCPVLFFILEWEFFDIFMIDKNFQILPNASRCFQMLPDAVGKSFYRISRNHQERFPQSTEFQSTSEHISMTTEGT